MKRLHAVAFFLTLMLAGCGGGDKKDLVADFSYPESVALLWRETLLNIQATGLEGNAPRCQLVSGRLPEGLELKSNCQVAGVPTETGLKNVVIRLTVEGYRGRVDKDVVFQSVGPADTYIGFESVLFRGGFYSHLPETDVVNTVAPGPWVPQSGETLRYTIESGELDPGLKLDESTGRIYGIASRTDEYSFRIQVTATGPLGTYTSLSPRETFFTRDEGVGFSYSGDFDIAIVGIPIEYSPFFSFRNGLDPSAYTFGEYRLAADSSPLPAGVSLDPVTGILSGTPTQSATFVIRVEVDLSTQGETVVYPASDFELIVGTQ